MEINWEEWIGDGFKKNKWRIKNGIMEGGEVWRIKEWKGSIVEELS
jgi:hypothetical protein